MKNNYEVYWNHIDKSTFMYGTQLQLNRHSLQFENYQIPAGIVIHVWHMKTSFYNDRVHPSLPVLSRNELYDISFNYECEPEQGIYFIIECYKKNDELVDTFIIKDKEYSFIYPDNADYYQIKMMSASVNTLNFDAMILSHSHLLMDMSNAIDIFDRWSNEVF